MHVDSARLALLLNAARARGKRGRGFLGTLAGPATLALGLAPLAVNGLQVEVELVGAKRRHRGARALGALAGLGAHGAAPGVTGTRAWRCPQRATGALGLGRRGALRPQQRFVRSTRMLNIISARENICLGDLLAERGFRRDFG